MNRTCLYITLYLRYCTWVIDITTSCEVGRGEVAGTLPVAEAEEEGSAQDAQSVDHGSSLDAAC